MTEEQNPVPKDSVDLYPEYITPPVLDILFQSNTNIENGYPFCKATEKLYSQPLEKPYPNVLWVQDDEKNDGIPFCQGMSDIQPIEFGDQTKTYAPTRTYTDGNNVIAIYYSINKPDDNLDD